MTPKFFKTPADFRKWLSTHHDKQKELLVGFYKKDSGRPSVTWPESVDEALCFGWIDGVRRRIDHESYSIRFTPRRSTSIWSAVNIKRANELLAAGRMAPSGKKAFAARKENRSGIYSYEQRSAELIEPYATLLSRNKKAAKFFSAQPPSYRKAANWWIVSAKQEDTRRRRLTTLIELSASGRRLPSFDRKKQ
ncbi:MAG TPA: YdeI/OmpD-associated family protein [Pyrinomonadaceae bacterium]|nr:YdeI/OmpD-associated family protein [Pyrinomonadaceae bacterium]